MVSKRMPELVVPAVEDAGRIAAVINARAIALGGATEESAEGVARWFALPFIDPAEDMRLALDDGGTAVGYADASGPEDGTPKSSLWHVALGVDAENTTGAVALYERVGMHVVRRSDTWERTA